MLGVIQDLDRVEDDGCLSEEDGFCKEAVREEVV